MVKISKDEKKVKETYDEDKQKFVTSFAARFNVDKLIEFQEEEEKVNKIKYLSNIKNKYEAELGEGSIKDNNIEFKSKDYEAIYPKSIKYIRENIFIAEKGKISYIININNEGNLFPMEYTKDEFEYYREKFIFDLQQWFKKYYTSMYRVETALDQPRIYVNPKSGLKHLNIFNVINLVIWNTMKLFIRNVKTMFSLFGIT